MSSPAASPAAVDLNVDGPAKNREAGADDPYARAHCRRLLGAAASSHADHLQQAEHGAVDEAAPTIAVTRLSRCTIAPAQFYEAFVKGGLRGVEAFLVNTSIDGNDVVYRYQTSAWQSRLTKGWWCRCYMMLIL